MASSYKKKNKDLGKPLLSYEDSVDSIEMQKKSTISDVNIDVQSTVSMPIKSNAGNTQTQPQFNRAKSDGSNANYFQQATLRHIDFRQHTHSNSDTSAFNASKLFEVTKKHAYDNTRNYVTEKDREASERQNFDTVDNEITHLDSFVTALKNHNKVASRGLLKWFTCIMIGVMTGMCMVAVTSCVGLLQTLLWYWFRIALKSGFGYGYVAFFTFSLLCACAAGGAVLYSPRAAGSGIPEVKAYLNGNLHYGIFCVIFCSTFIYTIHAGSAIPGLFYVKTLCAKLIGVTAAVSGSFMVGKEGPMVHSGAAIASGIGKLGILCTKGKYSLKFLFGTDLDKRDLISCGAAAGVSAAFGAPIGGMLFALEEVSSFWRPGLNWRAFFAAAVSNFTVLAILPCIQNQDCGSLQKTGLIDFVGHPPSDIGVFDLVNLVCFVILGICGGLIGASFNHVNVVITGWRNKLNEKMGTQKWHKFIEVMLISVLTVSVLMVVPYLYGRCIKVDCYNYQTVDETCENVVHYGRFLCEEDEYNPMASLLQPPREGIIEGLFYYQKKSDTTKFTELYPNDALWIAFFCYYFVSVVTYGIGIPSGLFVPIILIGATFGHVMGIYFNELLGKSHAFDVGTYSLLGAAALLGGTTRMTISLTVILVEITNDVYYLLPIILTIMIAKWVGDQFNIPLYDAHIVLKNIPFLEPDLPKWFPTFLVAKDIMKTPVITLPRFCSLKRVLHVLSNKEFNHNCFPVVIENPNYKKTQKEDEDKDEHLLVQTKKEKKKKAQKAKSRTDIDLEEYHKYTTDESSHHLWIGLILRSNIMALLKNKCYRPKHELSEVQRLTSLELERLAFTHNDRQLESLEIDAFEIDDIRYQTRQEEEDGDFLDLTPYMHLSPHTVRENTPIRRIYSLFRGLGLRHLMVTNAENELVGIITAHELDEHALEHLVEHTIHEHSGSDHDKTKYASERMSFLRGNDQYDAFESYSLFTERNLTMAFTDRSDKDETKKKM